MEGAWGHGVSYVGRSSPSRSYLSAGIVMTPEWWCVRYNTSCSPAAVRDVLAAARTRSIEASLRTLCLVLIRGVDVSVSSERYFGEVLTAVAVAVGAIREYRVGRPLADGPRDSSRSRQNDGSRSRPSRSVLKQSGHTRRWRNLLAIAVRRSCYAGGGGSGGAAPFCHGYEWAITAPGRLMPYSASAGVQLPAGVRRPVDYILVRKGLSSLEPGLLLPNHPVRRGSRNSIRETHVLWIPL